MSVIEFNVVNGSDSLELLMGDTYFPVLLTSAEEILMNDAITELQGADDSNNLWYSDSDVSANQTKINLKSSSVDDLVSIYDKGIFTTDELIYPVSAVNLPALADSVLTRIYEAYPGCLFTILINRTSATDYLIEVQVYDSVGNIDHVDMAFTGSSGPAPIPTEPSLSLTSTIAPNGKLFEFTTLTTEDPEATVGETYSFVVDFKDVSNVSLGAIPVDIVVTDINYVP